MSEEVFRLKLSMGTKDSGGGEWPMFDDREEFKTALLEAALEVEARGDLYRQPVRQRILAWVLRKQPQSVDKKRGGELRSYGVRRVFAAEQFIDGEWKNLDWRIHAPYVEISAPGQPL